jgi:Uma2 family endonuclease
MASASVFDVVMPADHVPGPSQGQWTYDDYARIPDDGQRYEVIDGVLYMAPAPGEGHQNAVVNFAMLLGIHVKTAGLGRVYVAPFDVTLPPGINVQPDVVVVLNANLGIITPGRIIGSPDLVIEIASPGTATYDRSTKLQAYERAGVAEYWIADPYAKTIEVLRLHHGSYRSLKVYAGAATLPTAVVPNLPVTVDQFFA